MRDFIVLTAVCLAVVLGVGWLLLPGTPADLFRSRVTVHAETPDPPDTPVAEEQPHQKISRVSAHAEPDSAHPGPAAAALDPIPAPPAAAPASQANAFANLPLPWDVLPGEAGSDVVDNYGAPSLATSTQDSGHLFETYVYRNSGRQSIVHLEDGRVSRVSLKDSLRPPRP